ncbi:MAG: FG-GAP repeat protein [Acidobacteria bacterium]|nr:FG-GAP repeat protein [Acidobacteriota bacterium]
MKRRIPIILTILSLLFTLGLLRLWLTASTTGDALPALQGEAALNHLKEQGLYSSLQQALAAARYGLYQESKQSAAWLANNPAQQLHARFTPDGVQVETRGDDARSRRLGMRLRSAGYGERQIAVSTGRLTTSGNRAEIHHDWRQSQISNLKSQISNLKPQITEWYLNTAAGLEQGFTLGAAPGERREGERLRVALVLEGDLRAQAVDGGQSLKFVDEAGRQQLLRYDHLVVRDGRGRELEARMAVRMEAGEGEVWLEVDDRDALWPVTIDPTFTQQQKLVGSDAAAGDLFGLSVAISGETVVVGASFDAGVVGIDQGSAYVFVRSGGVWSEQQKLEASDAAAGDLFGISVAISGETVVVGARLADGPAGPDQGSAYVFVRSGGVWSEQQKLMDSDEGIREFGASVAISGETAVVGTPLYDGPAGAVQGLVDVFVRSGGVWTEQQKLLASDTAVHDRFGWSVAISGETVVVGAPFDADSAGPNQGSVYVFVRSGGVWNEQQKLLASDAAAGDRFGNSVSISGETVVVGAPLDDELPAGVDQGSAYVFVRSGGVWSTQQKLLDLDAAGINKFGWSVAISGETVVVGAIAYSGPAGGSQGSVDVFVRSGGVWSTQQKLLASDAAAGDQLGFSAAISGDTVVVGAWNDDDSAGADQGSAYVFVPSSTNTTPTITATGVTRQEGAPASTSTIATVSDAEDAENTLTISVNGAASAEVNGVTVSSIIVNASGQVTANVGAACGATNASFTLRVTDSGGLLSEDSLSIIVTHMQLTALSPAKVWVGLKNNKNSDGGKNSDNVETKFDLLAEVFKNETLIGSGQLDGVSSGSNGFNKAVLNTINLGLPAPVNVCPGDILKIKLSVRIAANSGHLSGTARLWFNDAAANSRFDATIGGVTNDHFLLDGFTLSTVAGVGPKMTIDVLVNRAVDGNPFKPFGTWSKTF